MNIRLAAIVHEADSREAQAALEAFIRLLQAKGLRVGGLIAAEYTKENGEKDKCIRAIESGRLYPIFQDLGNNSESCRLDPSKLVLAASELLALQDNPPDLAVINRFGIMEADGGGFCQEFMDLAMAGIPVLTLLNGSKYLAAWRAFGGENAQELTADLNQLEAWFSE
ncbi:MAG: DUF2478 domain-containing protein [Neisseria sp.]|uniref:DUF2478 domain-containing protein n=1 Tax=Neisseria sp. TaxID=192066 RepID=UPI0026DAFB1E|nr:DUF2478 domain-containing protein [Neisseria sp.]MDO4640464.1 DUF2478 domain-containing protein [Neisseria sp.]